MHNGLVSDFTNVKPKRLDGRKARRKRFKVVELPPGTGLAKDEEGNIVQVRARTGRAVSKRTWTPAQAAKGKGTSGFVRGDRVFREESTSERLRPASEAEFERRFPEAHREFLRQLRGESTCLRYGQDKPVSQTVLPPDPPAKKPQSKGQAKRQRVKKS
jgi:hypothetical protein